ncbi:MAG: TldD/PmbA family protein [Dehalococcoidia bacterium]
MANERTPLEAAQIAVELAMKAGAGQADAFAAAFVESEVTVRMGEIERLFEAGSRSVGLRVITGGRTAVCSTADLSDAALRQLAADAVELAAISAPDEHAGLPEAGDLARDRSAAELQTYDEAIASLTTDEKLVMARACESAALGMDKRITNSDGARMETRAGDLALANSLGFSGGYPVTSVSLMVEVMADDEGGKKRNAYWYSSERALHRMQAPEEIGRIAARRAVEQLGARKVPTTRVPVVFEPMMAASLAGAVAGCASGSALYRGATFLKGKEGTRIGSPLVTIVDDPHLAGRPGARPFDGEGVASRRTGLMHEGVFQAFLFDCYSARRSAAKTTGSASRGVSSLPMPGASNLIWEGPGGPVDAIIRGIDRGLYVNGLMGNGFNPTTGDYSRGAAGFWIERGEIAFPVTEVNISAHFGEMLAGVDAIGDDLTWFGSVAVPTVRIAEMTVSGD